MEKLSKTLLLESLMQNIKDVLLLEGKNETLASQIDFESKRIPFISHYPEQCCEIMSLLIGYVVASIHTDVSIKLCRGKIPTGEHFWLSVNNKQYDFTASQIDTNISDPLVFEGIHPYITSEGCRENIATAFNDSIYKYKSEWVLFIKRNLNEKNNI